MLYCPREPLTDSLPILHNWTNYFFGPKRCVMCWNACKNNFPIYSFNKILVLSLWDLEIDANLIQKHQPVIPVDLSSNHKHPAPGATLVQGVGSHGNSRLPGKVSEQVSHFSLKFLELGDFCVEKLVFQNCEINFSKLWN